MPSHWLVKSEPSSYAWSDLENDGTTPWTGVRNFQARNNLRAMKKGDRVLFYQSVTDPSVRGITRVIREAYPDPTANEGDWSCVDLEKVAALPHPVTLGRIKSDPSLGEMALIKQSRLSVMPITERQFDQLTRMGSK